MKNKIQKILRRFFPYKSCERCGNIGPTNLFSGTPESRSLFKTDYYEKPLRLCGQCFIAHDVFMNQVVKLTIETQLKLGHFQNTTEPINNETVKSIALLATAQKSMDWARRVTNEESWQETRAWIEKNLLK